jgi:LytS/YehU family sensor histidine kinase
MLIYWVIVTVTHAMVYYQRYVQRELRAAELERMLTQSKLQALQMQLNPHFLFNTLHAISTLMHTDVKAADKTITRLSDLLRYALDKSDVQEVPLKDELKFLDGYLEIQQTRFGERLTVQKSISPDVLEAQVPNLILQPIVENAIRHGIEPNAKPGVLELSACRKENQLELQVNDNGAGLSEDAANRARIGLSNTRTRLEQLYGAAQKFTLENRPNGGVAATLIIPFHIRNGAPNEGPSKT